MAASGRYHSRFCNKHFFGDLWFNLDALFVDTEKIAPQVAALAEMVRPYSISAVCGPLLGGAFLAQAVAMQVGPAHS